MAAMGYISEHSYACLARDSDNPSDFDRGLAPFQLMVNLKSAHESLGTHRSLDGLTVGTRLATPGVTCRGGNRITRSLSSMQCPTTSRRRWIGKPIDTRRFGEGSNTSTATTSARRSTSAARRETIRSRSSGPERTDTGTSHRGKVGATTRQRRARPCPRSQDSCASMPMRPSFKRHEGSSRVGSIREGYDTAFDYLSSESLSIL